MEGLSVAARFAAARGVDVPALATLILTHGPNAWNWLPAEGVQSHLLDIAAGHAHAVLAWHDQQLVGAATYCLTHDFRRHQASDRADAEHGYVCEVVVAPEYAGRGLGSQLLREVSASLAALGVCEIYIDRHEENAASAGMMRKAGFQEIETFAEPARRPHGSGRTTVCRLICRP